MWTVSREAIQVGEDQLPSVEFRRTTGTPRHMLLGAETLPCREFSIEERVQLLGAQMRVGRSLNHVTSPAVYPLPALRPGEAGSFTETGVFRLSWGGPVGAGKR